ncbi:hypothetical protein CKO23_21180 [Thiocystis violacea]|nr:hypothetical protein [Thiocystis violacea]
MDYLRELITNIQAEAQEAERERNRPPRTYKPDDPREIVFHARVLFGKDHCEVSPDWLDGNQWTAEQAGWLGLGIDPDLVAPDWRLPSRLERGLRPLASKLTSTLRRIKGETAAPAAYVKALRQLGIEHAWMDATPKPQPKFPPDDEPSPATHRTYLNIVAALSKALADERARSHPDGSVHSLKHSDGRVKVGHGKDSGPSGIVGHLMGGYTSLGRSCLEARISEALKQDGLEQ